MSIFKLKVETLEGNPIVVQQFEGTEGISRLFKFDIDASVETDSELHLDAELVGAPAVFTMEASTDLRRHVHGVVARVTKLNLSAADLPLYRFRIVPHLWLRKHRTTSRVFQKLNVPDIVTKMLSAGDNPPPDEHRWQESRQDLRYTYPIREYAVQYRESDYAFVERILAEEGIYYYFQHSVHSDLPVLDDFNTDAHDVMVLGDGIAYPTLSAPALQYGTNMMGLDPERALYRFELSSQVKPDAAMLRDYDFERPLHVLEASSLTEREEGVRIDRLVRRPRALRVYEHRGEYLRPEVDTDRTQRHLEQQRRKAYIGRGASAARHLMPGYRFQVTTAPQFDRRAPRPPIPPVTIPDALPEIHGDYVVTRIKHRGKLPDLVADTEQFYTNEFECVPSDIAYRPKRPVPKPIQVLESAVVVGMEPGSILTDEHGRVRVQFHWDLEGRNNEESTTWLRVIQGWSGSWYGIQFIPRVGMEVMVAFLGGDPDSPVVVGAIPNATHPVPFHLPEQATRSGIRTESFPGGSGFNELSFDDASGAEQFYIHAQRDFDTIVKHNQTTQIEKSQITEIGENQTNRVAENQAEMVGGRSERTVASDETIDVRGNRVKTVGGNDTLNVEKEWRVRVGLNERIEVAGRASSLVKDDISIRAEGNMVTVVGQATAPRGYALHVEGTTDVSSEKWIQLVSKEGIQLRCGESIVSITPKTVDIVSPHVNIRSADAHMAVKDDGVEIRAKAEATFKSGESMVLATDSASLSLRTEVRATGQKILLNAPDKATDPPPQEDKPPTIIELVDNDGKPLAYQRFVLVDLDGAERSFALDANGRCEVPDISVGEQIRFPELIDPQTA